MTHFEIDPLADHGGVGGRLVLTLEQVESLSNSGKYTFKSIQMFNPTNYQHTKHFIVVSALWYADYLVTPSVCPARTICTSRTPSADANLMPRMSLSGFCEHSLFAQHHIIHAIHQVLPYNKGSAATRNGTRRLFSVTCARN